MKNYYLGIDVSKGNSDFVLLNEKKQTVLESFQLDDTFEGHNKLFKILSEFFTQQPDTKIFAAVESTGGYENNWYHLLHKYQGQLNLSVARLNPYGVNYNSKADLKRIKTDAISAVSIAEYLISHPEKVSYQTEDPFASLRRQWTFIKMLTKQRVQLLNQLESLLYVANTEILYHCRNKVNLWTLKLLKQYPTAKHLAKARVSTISKIPYITETLAKELINKAKHSVASETDETIAEIITATVNQILSLRKTICLQVKKLQSSCNLPEVALLKSFSGIADYSAVGLIIEIGSVERFSSVKKLACFFGVHPVFSQSGDKISGYRMSKRGRKEPRQILFNVARFAIVHNPLIKEIYIDHLKKGMSKMAAIGAIMHKILRIVYGILKNNTPFNPEIDRANRLRNLSKKKDESLVVNKMLEPIDCKAPVSRRQLKKRKEQEKSQNLKPLNAEQIVSVFAGSDSRSFPFASTQT